MQNGVRTRTGVRRHWARAGAWRGSSQTGGSRAGAGKATSSWVRAPLQAQPLLSPRAPFLLHSGQGSQVEMQHLVLLGFATQRTLRTTPSPQNPFPYPCSRLPCSAPPAISQRQRHRGARPLHGQRQEEGRSWAGSGQESLCQHPEQCRGWGSRRPGREER